MNDLDPIELGIVLNSDELIQDFNKIMLSSKSLDESILQSKASFQSFIQAQLSGVGILNNNAKLTDKQSEALTRHSKTLEWLKEQILNTFDETQLKVYQYQLSQTESAIKHIIDSANNKVELLNDAELIESKRKLEDVGRLLDEISDKTFTPSFASNAELETLSEHINRTDDEMEQLGIVIDFVSNKLEQIDPASAEFAELANDINTANTMLGRSPAIYDSAGNSIDQMNDALKEFQAQLANETDPQKISILNQNIQNLENSIRAMKNAGRAGFDELGNKIEKEKNVVVQLQTELENLIQKMARLRLENNHNSSEYQQLTNRAIEIRQALNGVNQEVNASASVTSNLDSIIRATTAITAGFSIAQSSAVLFGKENENLSETIAKVTSTMAILQGFQQIQLELKRQDTLLTNAQTLSQKLYNIVVGNSTGALKTFRIALASTGVGIFIVLLGELIANWDKVKKAIGLTSDEIEQNTAITKKANDLYGEHISKLQFLVTQNKGVELTERQKKKAVEQFNDEFSDTLGAVKDYAELERKIINNAPKYVQYLQLKAQADAAYILSLEKQKTLLEQITALSVGDLKWYEKISQKTDTLFEKGWKLLGFDTGTAKTEISTEEILNMLGYSEKDFDKAIKVYSASLQQKLKTFRKEKLNNDKLTNTAIGLQQDLSSKADELNIKEGKLEKEKQDKKKSNESELKKLAEERNKLIKDISEAERNIMLQTLSDYDRQIEEIKKKYSDFRKEAKKLELDKIDNKIVLQIDSLEKTELENLKYKQSTDDLITQLEKEKELFKAYEELKTSIAFDELSKQSENSILGFENFSERIQQEMDKILSKHEKDRTNLEKDRLLKLEELKTKSTTEEKDKSDRKYIKAYEESVTYYEKIKALDKEYLENKKELEKVTDIEIREVKIQELEKQKKAKINALKLEYNESLDIWRNLESDLTGLSKKELDNKINSLDEYYKISKDYLDKDQQTFIESEIDKAKSINGRTDLEVREKNALEKKKKLLAEINSTQIKSNEQVAKEAQAFADINDELEEIRLEKLAIVVGELQRVSNIANLLASAFAESNDELSKIFKTLSELAEDIGNVIGAFTKGIVNGIVALVAALIKWVGKLFTMGKRARESRKQAIEEMKKWQAEIIAQQLEYNKTLREREQIEASINDLYVSRVQNIREEMEALKKNKVSVMGDMDRIWQRLLGSETIFDKTFKKKGGFLGFAKKTKVVDHYDSVANLLGIDKDTQITDELFSKLEKLNAMKPLTGDAKEAYEQLKKLRDEYGSIDDALKQLEIDLKNAVTGTTAQSIADSIKEGIKSGKKTFADFADDIEGFLREAILSGMSAKILEPEMQKLQDLLFEMMGDGVLTDEERKQWQEIYLKVAKDAQEYLDLMNQAGINMSGSLNRSNSLKGAIEGMTAEQADLLAGQFGGLRLTQLETNNILKNGAAQQLQQTSRMIEILGAIENNTKRTANNTEILSELPKIKALLEKMAQEGGRSSGL